MLGTPIKLTILVPGDSVEEVAIHEAKEGELDNGQSELSSELKRCGEKIIGIAEMLTEMFTSADTETQTEKEKAITLEEVRAILAEKSRNGFTAQVRELLIKHGADRLSGINPAEYEALIKETEVLGNE